MPILKEAADMQKVDEDRGVARNISQGGHKNSREGRLLSERNMDCLDSREILLLKNGHQQYKCNCIKFYKRYSI